MTDPSDFAKKHEIRGVARGEVSGEAKSIVKVLRGRGICVSDAARERILGCTDEAQLDVWLDRAVTVETAEQLFD
ncbi:hypothetical protein [Spirillospora sp. NPDC047279]|uniref:hypothetical protein n=1 Tax=Spirillospora sp. NPDC047279 TaxID=3155478 RepID=UPI0034112180